MPANRSRKVSVCGALIAGALFFMTTPAFAQQATTDAKGSLREPTREEIQILLEGVKELVSQSHEGLTVVEHPDGTLSLDHQGRFQSVMVAKTNPDGSVSMECVSTVEQAQQFLADQKQQGPVKPLSVKPVLVKPVPVKPSSEKPVSSGPKKTAPQASTAEATGPAKLEEK